MDSDCERDPVDEYIDPVFPRLHDPGRTISFDADDDAWLVDHFFILRSGFLQHKGSAGSGCTRIMREMDLLFGGHKTRVELEPWDACPEQTAEYIYRLGRKDTPPDICIFAYSWGAGYGFVNLARALHDRGLRVHTAVLCDPVHYSWARWRALLPQTLFHRVISVNVPPNVDRVHRFWQRIDKPAGHPLKLESGRTQYLSDTELHVPHTEMDNTPEFRRRCLEVAHEVVRPRLRGQCETA